MMRAVKTYLAVRRTLGYRLVDSERILRRFARFAASRGERYVRTQTVIDWAHRGPSPNDRYTRLQIVRLLARYLHAEDPRHQVPADNIFRYRKQHRVPYIYSDREIVELLQELARLGPPGSLRPLTFTTLFGLLATTGLRISEALNLRMEDNHVDGLLIRQTKFRKSRLVPLHGTTQAALHRYLSARSNFPTDDPHIFVSLYGRRIHYATINPVFRRILEKIGVRKGNGPQAARIHDLRHTFCTKALLQCPDRDRIDRHMLAVTTYVGHAEIASTYWYMHATPQLMTDISGSSERFFRRRKS